jgi:hypothetical protein
MSDLNKYRNVLEAKQKELVHRLRNRDRKSPTVASTMAQRQSTSY